MILSEPFGPLAGPPIERAEADIVFVHGLGGDAQHTWSCDDGSIFWPNDLLPEEYQSARIFTYGYDVMSYAWDSGRIQDNADAFLADLDASREGSQIPIIFIAHSLGGIVLRDALNRECKKSKSRILDAIRWLCFLGTPNFASDDDWIKFGQALAKDRNEDHDKAIRMLPRMRDVNAQFASWLKTRPKSKLEVCCFHEFPPVENAEILVPKEASDLPGIESRPVLKDHFGLTKVENTIDPLYRTISDHLKPMLEISFFPGNNFRKSRSSSNNSGSSRRTSQAQGMEEALCAKNTPEDAKIPTRLVISLDDRGRVKAALEALKELIDNMLEVPLSKASTGDQIVFFCHDRYASVLRKCGRLEEAEAKCREVLSAKRSVFGESHPTTLETVGNLALILRSRGRFHDAIQELTDNIEPSAQYADEAFVQIKLFSILSKVYKDVGYYDLAELLARDVLIASIRQFGVDDVFTLTRASDLAVVLAKQKRLDFAEELARRSNYLLEHLLGREHRYSLRASQRLAFINMLQGKLDDAAKRYERTRLALEDQLGQDNQNTLAAISGLGTTYLRQGRIEDGEAFLQKALKGQLAVLGDDHPDTLWTSEALKHLDGSWARIKPSLPLSKSDTRLYDFLRRPSKPQELHPTLFPEITSMHAPGVLAEATTWDYKLRWACHAGDMDKVQAALAHSPDINSIGGICGTPLLAACYSGNEELVRLLVEKHDADVNRQGGLFGTPLRAAAFCGHEAIVRYLIYKSASPNVHDGIRGSALCAALITNNASIVKSLLQGGANKYANDDIYGTALHEAAMNGQDELVEIFLEEDQNPNLRAGLFGTAIEASAWGGHATTINLLLKHNASLDGRHESRNAIYLASARGNKEALRLLQQKVKELKERASGGKRPDGSPRAQHSQNSSVAKRGGSGELARVSEEESNEPAPSPEKPRRSPMRMVKTYSRRLTYRFRRRAS